MIPVGVPASYQQPSEHCDKGGWQMSKGEKRESKKAERMEHKGKGKRGC